LLVGALLVLSGVAGAQQLETGVLPSVGNTWQTVTLSNTYASMVVICTPSYMETQAPVVTRVRNAAGNSFEVMVQNPSNTAVSGYPVYYMVVEEGVYAEAVHGVKMEAVKFTSTLTAENDDWGQLEARAYQNTYTAPVVLGQVMTYNDTNWSVFLATDGTQVDPPSATALSVGKHVAEDTNVTRNNETIGYIVIETGTGEIDGVPYTAALGPDSVLGMDDAPPYTYTISGLATPYIAVLSAAAMDGANGGWPVLYGPAPILGTQMLLAYDEDQVGDTERVHISEEVAYIVFNYSGPSVSRILGGQQYTPGGAPVQVTLVARALDADATIVVTETLPAGVTGSNANASSGSATIAGATVTWTVDVAANTSEVLTYDASVGTAICRQTVQFDGTFDAGGGAVPILGETDITQIDDGWENAPIGWTVSETIGDDLPLGWVEWYACQNPPGGTYEVFGDGHDIWDAADDFQFLYAFVDAAAGFTLQATVEMQLPVHNAWAKGGLMVRANNSAGSPYVIVAASNTGPGAGGSNDIAFQWRDDQDGGAAWTGGSGEANNGPVRLVLNRQPSPNHLTIACAYDTLGDPGPANPLWLTHDAPNIPDTGAILVGLAFTSHSTGNVSSALFYDVDLQAILYTPAVEASTRTIQATEYTAGTPVPVTVDIGRNPDTVQTAITVTETIPPGWTASNISDGGQFAGGVITWNLTNFTADVQISYDATAPAGTIQPGSFSGGTVDGVGISKATGGDTLVLPAGVIVLQQGNLPTPAYAGCEDAHIVVYSDGNNNAGTSTFLEEGDWSTGGGAPGNGDEKQMLFRFDVSDQVSPLDTVQQALLRIYYFNARLPGAGVTPNRHTVYAARVLRNWNEGAGGQQDGRDALDGEVCWNEAQFNVSPWGAAGARDASDIALPESQADYGDVLNVWVEFDVTQMVRAWAVNPNENFGVKISQDAGIGPSPHVQILAQIHSSESPEIDLRPMLLIQTAGGPGPLSANHWELYR
jgi:hypothetical protein